MIKTVISNCKINIGLNVTGILENGYHTLDMIMAPIDLSDKMIIKFTGKPGKLKIHCNNFKIPEGKDNILDKIYNRYYSHTQCEKQEIEVWLEKNIPTEAGLGGGSSNGAFFLKELNSYHEEPMGVEALKDLAKNVGADIPFFIENSCCRVRGIGERLEKVENRLNCRVLLLKPNFGVSTPEAYGAFDRLLEQGERSKKADIESIIQGLEYGKQEIVEGHIENHLEQGLLRENIQIREFRERLENEARGLQFFMSGSGSTYFTLIEPGEAQKVYDVLKSTFKDCEVFLCSFL